MPTILLPEVNGRAFADNAEGWRFIVKNNKKNIPFVWFWAMTDETWLPTVLTQLDFFPSNGQVRKNKPELWRDIQSNEENILLSWAKIHICRVNFDPSSLVLEPFI